MDDFTKKDKYSSIHSAIKDVVSQNNDLYQKALEEKYGFTQSEQIEEAKMKDSEVLAAAKKLADNGKDEKAKSFGKGLVDFYEKNKSFTPDQVAGLQNIMKNAPFQMAKEEVELNEAAVSMLIDLNKVKRYAPVRGLKTYKDKMTKTLDSEFKSKLGDYELAINSTGKNHTTYDVEIKTKNRLSKKDKTNIKQHLTDKGLNIL